jgi:E3 ubiquitin-protein ligase BAH
MKFGKSLGQIVEDIPSDLRPFTIQYKKLKRCIHKIVQELDDKGISQDVRKTMLDATEGYHVEYSVETNPIHIRPYIKLYMTPDTQLFNPLTENYLESAQSDFTSYPSMLSIPSLSSSDSSDTESTSSGSHDSHDSHDSYDSHDDINADTIPVCNSINTESTGQSQKTMYIELEADREFFNTLLEEISQLNDIQRQKRDEYTDKVNKLSDILIKATSPYKKDMYTWREIFQLYLQAEIFIGSTEADRGERDWQSAQKQLKWFSDSLSKMKLPRKLKLKSSKEAFREFLRINNELLVMKRFQDLNQTATSKILKKHDKRTCLTYV